MAYMRGTYYVYRTIGDSVAIHVGHRPELHYATQEEIDEWDKGANEGAIRIPLRVMKDLAAKFWLEMPQEEKDRYMNDPYYEPYRIRARRARQE